MKKVLFIIACVLTAQMALAQAAWTVQTIPNTRLESNFIHVSDPDGYLSDSAEYMINSALDSIRDQADVFVVTVTSIGDAEPKHFATRLFNYWGIGDAATDNGVLLLFVEDQRALEFETGYGAENTLTDARCARIFNNTIVPYFREGDYEGGLCAGVIDIVEVYGGAVPMGLKSMAPMPREEETSESDDSDLSLAGALIVLFFIFMAFIIPIISFLRWITGVLQGKKKKKEELEETVETFEQDGVSFIKSASTNWKSSVWEGKGFLRFLVYGVGAFAIFLLAEDMVPEMMPEASETRQEFWSVFWGVIVYFSLTCLIQNGMLLSKANRAARASKSPRAIYTKARNDAHSMMMRILAPWFGIPLGILLRNRINKSVQCICPTCGAEMNKDESFQIPEIRAAEERAGAYRFTPCRCASGHVFVLREDGLSHSSVRQCRVCDALAGMKIKEKTIVSPTYTSSGTKEVTYECQFCHAQQVVRETLPKLVRTTSSSSSSRSHHSSSHSGGSFGGGHSGGGGYSGRW